MRVKNKLTIDTTSKSISYNANCITPDTVLNTNKTFLNRSIDTEETIQVKKKRQK